MSIGTKQITADGYVNSTKPTRIYSAVLKGSGASTTALKNANLTSYDSIVSADGSATRVNYEGGLLFPGGCYVDVGSNHTYITLTYESI